MKDNTASSPNRIIEIPRDQWPLEDAKYAFRRRLHRDCPLWEALDYPPDLLQLLSLCDELMDKPTARLFWNMWGIWGHDHEEGEELPESLTWSHAARILQGVFTEPDEQEMEEQAVLYRSLQRVHAKDEADVKNGKPPERTIRLCKQAAAKTAAKARAAKERRRRAVERGTETIN